MHVSTVTVPFYNDCLTLAILLFHVKPNTTQAMQQLIEEIRTAIPVELTADDLCRDDCNICAVKLIEFLNMELDDWEHRLQNNQTPNFGDLAKLAKTARKIHNALNKSRFSNNLPVKKQ